MTEQITIPYNDVFFYGVNLKSRENSQVKNDVYANIIMRYLRTLEPVSNRLYRGYGNDKYEYSYSFVPSKPLSWRVIKNRRVIEEIEYLSDGKYCLNYYDDYGRDVKRIFFSERHTWLKTNYYNTMNGDNILCSIVPKEKNGETAILLYPTGVPYPTTLYCCKQPSCNIVFERVMARVPDPEISALTNYGVMYFASEQTFNIYNQVLTEEEEKYLLENKPPVYTTDEDIAGGFNFTKESFSSNSGAVFSLSEAQELSDVAEFISQKEELGPVVIDVENKDSEVIEDNSYSLKSDLAEALEIIESRTNIHVDSSLILNNSEDKKCPEESIINEISSDSIDSNEINFEEEKATENASSDSEKNLAPAVADNDKSESMISVSTDEVGGSTDVLSLDDDSIDDYVKTLIDSLLVNAKSAVNEYSKGCDDGFSADEDDSEKDNIEHLKSQLESDQKPEKEIESGDEKYYFFGDYDEITGRNGRGKTVMESGLTAYEGDYLCDMRHGVGSFYYRSGDLCYYGDWKKNKRQGFGLGISSDTGIAHVGRWDNNKPSGVGVRFDRNGSFLYLDSHCEKVNGGIRVVGFTDKSLTIEYWDEKTLKTIKKEIFIDEI